MPKPAAKLLQYFSLAIAIYLGICLLFSLLQRALIFPGSATLTTTPTQIGLAFEDVWLAGEGAERIHGWYVPHPAARAQVLFLHGNGGNISGRLETLRILHGLGLSTLIVDYPGYGQSEGQASEEGCYLAARAGQAYLRAEPGAQPLIIWGRSLGGGVAVQAALDEQPTALILESTFSSLPDVGAHHYPWLPVQLLSRTRMASASKISAITCPKLHLHSPGDGVVPFEFGERLFEAAAEPKRFVRLTGDHNSGFLLSGETYLAPLREFLDEHCAARGPAEQAGEAAAKAR